MHLYGRVVIVGCLIICAETAVRSPNDEKITFIMDFVDAQTKPTMITAFLCWDQYSSRNLYKRMSNSESFYGLTIADPNKRPLPYPLPQLHVMFILDLSCSNVFDLLTEADKLLLFAAPYRWLILSDNHSEQDHGNIKKMFSNISVYADNEVVIAERSLNDNSCYSLIQLYKITVSSSITIEHYGVWSAKTGILDQRPSKYACTRRSDFMGAQLTASVVITHNDTLNHLEDYKFVHIDTMTKVNYFFTNYAFDALNVTRRFIYVDTWGYRNKETNFYNGMIGQLQRHEADISGTALMLTRERIGAIEYIAPTTETAARFVFRQPPLSYVSNLFVMPFGLSIWISGLSLVALICFLLYWVIRWEWLKSRTDGSVMEVELSDAARIRARLSDVMMLSLAAICQQGSSSEPRGDTGRFITVVLFIALMFLYTAYSAQIVALLQSTSPRIQTLTDLLESRLKIGAQEVPYNRYYFPMPSYPARKAIYDQKIAPPGQQPQFMSIEEGVKRIRNGQYAFGMELGGGYKVIRETFYEHEKCGLQEIDYLGVASIWMVLPINSSYSEIFKVVYRKIHERGIQKREMRRIYTSKPECIGQGSSFVSVGLIDTYSAFYMLLFGFGLAGFVTVLEIIYDRCRKRQNEQNLQVKSMKNKNLEGKVH